MSAAAQKAALMQNDEGRARVSIAQRVFGCRGASPPHDHPHIYLDMGAADEIRCPYCGTLYVYTPDAQGDRET